MRPFLPLLIASAAMGDVVSHWKFDELGGPTAFDSLGGNHGTLMGSASFIAGGISGGAISLASGSGDLVNLGDIYPMSGGVSQSIQVWVKTTTTSTGFPLGRHTSGIVAGYLIGIGTHGGAYGEPNKPHFYVSHGGGGEARGSTIVTDGVWHQIVCTFTGGIPRIYVDGAPIEGTGAATTCHFINAPLLVGGLMVGATPTATYTGLVDDIQVYNCALDEAAIQWLFDHPGEVFECYADCEGDCDLDVFDFLCFQGLYALKDPDADCEGDGDWDVFDFLCFQNRFAQGCPN